MIYDIILVVYRTGYKDGCRDGACEQIRSPQAMAEEYVVDLKKAGEKRSKQEDK